MKFDTAPWSNGKPNHLTGAGFGIRIPLRVRNQIFQKNWSEVILGLDGTKTEVALTAGFWNKCSELRSAEIGNWLIKHGKDRWPKGRPPRLTVTHVGGNEFILTA